MVGSRRIPDQARRQGIVDRQRRPSPWLLVAAIGAILLGVGAPQALAAPTVTVNSISIVGPFGGLQSLYSATGANVDGTNNTIFCYQVTITPPSGQTITSAHAYTEWMGGIGGGGVDLDLMVAWPNGPGLGAGGSTNLYVYVAGWRLVSGQYDQATDIFWQNTSATRRLRFDVYSSEAAGSNFTRTYSSNVTIGASGREVLVPLDSSNQPDSYRASRGGLTVAPADGANDDDGTSSSTYTFRVLYKHPWGLPPQVHTSYYNDSWRFPSDPDGTLPSIVNPPKPTTGVLLCFDTNVTPRTTAVQNADIEAPGNPFYNLGANTRDPAHYIARQANNGNRNSALYHYMLPATIANPTAEDYRNGVVYIYRVMPTNQEVAVGLPSNLYTNTSFAQNALNIFYSLVPWGNYQGIRNVDGEHRFSNQDNTRVKPTANKFDPQYVAPFLALSAGQHQYTYQCTSDVTHYGRDSFNNYVGEVYRFPDYNDPAYDSIVNQPALVFPEPNTADNAKWMQFNKPFVDPALSTDVSTAPGSIPGFEVNVATPVSVPTPLRAGQAGYDGSPLPTADEVLLVDSTRALSAETLRFKVYYVQSQGLAPVVKLITVYQKQAGGSFTLYGTKSLEEEPQGSYTTAKGLYYDWQLPQGEYRYYFRVSDGTRTAEWPGDSQAGSSLTMSLNTSHLANSIRVNNPPELSAPSVTPGFGNTGSAFTYEVTYKDLDNDEPRYAYLFVGTYQDSITAKANAAGQTTLTLADALAAPYDPVYAGGNPYGEIAVVARPGGAVPAALQAATFRIVSNNATQFVVDDPSGVLFANALNNDAIEIRRRVQMLPTGTINYLTGTKYQFTTSTDSTIRMEEGTRSYHFEFTDNWGSASDPETGETTRWYNGVNNEIQGPVIQSNRTPQLTLGKVTQPNDVTPPITGTSATQFTYSVRYTDLDNNPPTQMQVIIDPTEVPRDGPHNVGVFGQRVVQPTLPAGTGWTNNQWAGKVLKTSGRYYVIASNTAATDVTPSTLTLVPGTDLTSDGVLGGDSFTIIDVSGDIKAMTKSNASDNLYSDGADYEVTTRLAVGDHFFFFRASDGFTTVYHSTTGTPYAAVAGPTVNVNTPPRLQVAGVAYDSTADAGAVVSATSSSITVSGITLAANAWKNRVPPNTPYAIEVLTAGGPVVREMFEITDNDATGTTGVGRTVLTVRGDPTASGAAILPGDEYRIAPYPLDKVVALQGTTFTWRVAYFDDENDSPETGAPAMIRLVVDNNITWSQANIVRSREDATDQNFQDGVVYLFTTNALSSGTHSFFFEANDGANAVRVPFNGNLLGPAINNPPTLSGGSVTPTAGSRTNMYSFRVTYKDQDNDPPDIDTDGAPDTGYPRVIVRDPSGNILTDANNGGASYFVMRPETSGSYVTGIVYRYDLQNLSGLTWGKYTYEFQAQSTVDGRTQSVIIAPTDGPYVNGVPRLSLPSVVPDLTADPIGGPRAERYTYEVTYTDDENQAPGNGQPLLTIKREDGSTLQTFPMTLKTTGNDGNYANGEVYQYMTAANYFPAKGVYSYTVDSSDAVPANYASLTATQVSASGPKIDDIPVLSNLSVNPNTAGATSVFTFSARYTHPDNVAPASDQLTLYVYRPGGQLLDVNGTAMTTADVTPFNTTGRLYSASLTLSERGTFRFYVKASDRFIAPATVADTVVSPAGADTNSANAVSGPTVTGAPVLSNPGVSPSTGMKGTTQFTYSVTYRQAEGQSPANGWPKVYITDPNNVEGAGQTLTSNAPAPNFVTGVTYSLAIPLPAVGNYKFRFEVQDGQGGTDISPGPAATDKLTGPTVTNNPPTLTGDAVAPTSGRTVTKYVFTVVYTDADNDAPKDAGGNATKPTLLLDGQAVDPAKVQPDAGNDGNYTNGEIYTYTANPLNSDSNPANDVASDGPALAAGAHSFRWQGSDGTSTVQSPLRSQPTVNYIPVLSSPTVNGQASAVTTPTPMRLNPNAAATFGVTYTDEDGNLPGYIRVQLFKKNPTHDLVGPLTLTTAGTPSAAQIRAGVVYTASISTLAVGSYEYFFEASDNLDPCILAAGADSDPNLRYGDLVVNTLPTFSALKVTPTAGRPSNLLPGGVAFVFDCTYTDVDNQSPTTVGIATAGDPLRPADNPAGQADCVRLYVWEPTTTTPRVVELGDMAPAVGAGSVLSGRAYTKTVTLDYPTYARGVYRFYVKASDTVNTIVWPTGADVVSTSAATGPRVWSVPFLESPSVKPPGQYVAGALYKWTVTYRDDDSQPPSGTPAAVRLVVRKTDDTPVYDGPMSGAGTNWFVGVPFEWTQTLPAGTYKYRFEATDAGAAPNGPGNDTVYYPGPTAAEFTNGPVVSSNQLPEVVNVSVAPQKGTPGTAFKISATYKDLEGYAPAGSPGFPANTLLATILPSDGGSPVATLAMTPDVPANTAYATGVSYSATWTTSAATPADGYSFAVTATDDGGSTVWPAAGADSNWATGWTNGARIIVNNAPVLSNAQVSPGAGATNTNYIFTVDYRDVNNNDPASVTNTTLLGQPPAVIDAISQNQAGVYLVVTGPAGASSTTTGYLLQAPAGANFTGTVTYTVQSMKDITALQAGSYQFRFVAWDGIDTAQFPVTGTLSGPSVSGGAAPELSDASVLTQATNQPSGYRSDTFIYQVRYRDLDGDAPTPSLFKLYIDGTVVKRLDLGEVQRKDSNPYATGSYYTYTAPPGSLAVGTHTYRWEASDGTTTVSLPDTTLPPLTGPAVNNQKPTLTNWNLAPASGPANAEYVYTITYADADNDGPTNNTVSLLLDGQTIQMAAKDAADKTYTDGAIFEYRKVGLAALAVGQNHTYQFSASDGYDSVTVPTNALIGPSINHPPVLSSPTINPLKPTAAQAVTFTVLYQDDDGDLPSYIRVHVHRASDASLVGSNSLNPRGGTPTPAQIRSGYTYEVNVTGLQLGNYNHYFSAADALESVVLNAGADTDPVQRIPGPTVNTPPVVDNLSVTPQTGPPGTVFTFSARYQDADGQQPTNGKLELHVVKPDATEIVADMKSSLQTTFQTGRVYTTDPAVTLLPAIALTDRGQYSFYVVGKDEAPGQPGVAMETTTSATLVQPRVFDYPKLLNQTVTPGTGVQGRQFTWSVTYQDADGHAPDAAKPVTIYILDPSVGATWQSHVMTTTDPNPDYRAGVVYTYAETLSLLGTYRYYFDVTDESGVTEYTKWPATAPAAYFSGPTVQNTPPRLPSVSVNPSQGSTVTTFTWTALYLDDDDQAPAPGYPRVTIIGPDGNKLMNGAIPYFTMVAATPADTNYMDGKTYTFTRQLTTVGTYKFYVAAADAGAPTLETIVPLGADTDQSQASVGPLVGTNAPMLTVAQVKDPSGNISDAAQNNAAGNVNDTFTYSVKYAHGATAGAPLGLAPETIQVVIDGVAWNMVKKNAAETDFTQPIEYVYPTQLEYGTQHNFYFTASAAGKTARVPESGVLSGPTVGNRAPALTLGGVNPVQGVTTTNFTYSITYADADNQAPQSVQLIQVEVDPTNPGNTIQIPCTMTKSVAGATDYINGVVYQYTARLSGGTRHRYFFQASDGVTTTLFPAAGVVDGPSVPNTAPLLSAGSVSPNSGGTSTMFSFTVTYTDTSSDLAAAGDAPAQVRVFVDGDAAGRPMIPDQRASIPASLKDNDFRNGEAFIYQTNNLPQGAHNFWFQTTDSRGAGNDWQQETVRLPQAGTLSGPNVSTNTLPTLTNGTVTFPAGTVPTTATFFTYSVTYTDADNNPPARIQIFISENSGGTWAAQDLVKKDPTDNVYTDGVVYQLTQRFPPGKPTGTAPDGQTWYRYYFEAVDSVELAVVNDPASGRSGPYVGPLVNPNRNPTVRPSGSFTTIQTRKNQMFTGGYASYNNTYQGISPQPVGVPQYYRFPGVDDGGNQVDFLDPTYRYARFQELTFRAVYADPDNQPPAEMLCVVNANPTPMAKENPSDNDYVTGVTYIAKVKMDSNWPYRPPNASATLQSPQRGAYGVDTTYSYGFQCNDSNDPASRAQAGGNTFNVNVPPELHGPGGGGTGPSDTVWTFRVNYIDNNFPNNPFFNTNSGDRPIYVRVIIDGVAHDMEASGSDTDYNQANWRHPDGAMKPSWVTTTPWPTTGDGTNFVYSTKLPIGTHSFYYETTDGWDITKTAETNGPSVVNSSPVVTTPPEGGLAPATGTQATKFTYTAIYKDVDNQPPSRMEVVIDGNRFSMEKDATQADYTAGVTYRYATTLTAGTHQYRFEADDSNNPVATDRFPATQDSTGPIINYPPTLANGTVSPANGNEGTTYGFTVNYSDGDGQAPSFIKVFIDGTGFDLSKVDSTQNDFKKPIAYQYRTNLPGVPHTFYFKAGDGQEEVTTTTLSGPTVNPTNNAPVLSALAVTPGKGGPGQTFTYTATYTDEDNDAPTYVRALVYTSAAKAGDAPIATLTMAKVNPANTAFNAGVVYTATLNTLQGPDVYQFYVEASDADKSAIEPASADTTVANRKVGPTVNQAPTLGSGQVTPTVGGPDSNYVFTVTYTDPDNSDPALAKALVPVPTELSTLQPASDRKPGIYLELTAPDKVKTVSRMSATSNTFAAGASFQISFQKVLTAGTYNYRFFAWDGIDSIAFPATGTLTGPQVNPTNPPTLTAPSVAPDPGYKNDGYVYSITYKDLDDQAPTKLELWVDGQKVPDADISRQDPNAFSVGTVYSYARSAGTLGLGTHTYYWVTSDGTTEVRLPANAPATLTGPVVQNYAPTLTSGQVSPATGRANTEFTFSVVFTDGDDDPPSSSGVRLILDGVPQDPPMTMRQDQAGRKFSAGITYEYRVSGLSPGALGNNPHTYAFTVSDNTDSATTQTFNGPVVNFPPVLTAPVAPAATVTPSVADPLTAVRFTINYQDTDGQAPTTIRVFVHKRDPQAPDLVGGYTLTPASGLTPTRQEIINGVDYAVTVTGLQTGTYSHYFVASDTLDSVTFPAAADATAAMRLVGPTMNTAPTLALVTGSASGVTPTVGDVSDQYRFQVVYRQRNAAPPTAVGDTAGVGPVRLYVDGDTVGRAMTQAAGQTDFKTGVAYELTIDGSTLTTSPKPHTFRFSAFDGVQACFLDQSGLAYDVRPNGAVAFTGPSVNNKATLTNVRILALNDSNSTKTPVYSTPMPNPPVAALPTQRIQYEVTYQDVNNDPATQIDLYLDGSTTPVSLTEAAASTDAQRWSKGVVFAYTTAQPLSPGSHSFVIRARDGVDWTYVASGPQDVADPTKVDLSQGNVAAPPVMPLVTPRVTPNGGGTGNQFEFAVNFVSFLSTRTGYLGGLKAWAEVTQPSGAVKTVPLAVFGDAKSGVSFKGATGLEEFTEFDETGNVKKGYSFQIVVEDKVADPALNKAPQFTYRTSAVNQPVLAKPQLTNLSVASAKGVAGKGIVGENFEFSVSYQHKGKQPAGSVTLTVNKPDGTEFGTYLMATSDSNTDLLSTATGWRYKKSVVLNIPGTYSYSVVAYDGDAQKGAGRAAAPETPSQAGPEVTGPGLQAGSPVVSPADGGYAGGLFTFSAVYAFGANTPPAYVKLMLGNPNKSQTEVELVAASTGDYVSGKTFSKSIALPTDGDYSFYFEAQDPSGNKVTYPADATKPLSLKVAKPLAPTLSSEKVVAAGAGTNRYTYTVTYKQQQNLAPAWVKLYIDYNTTTGQAARVVDMVRTDPTATNYDAGVEHTYTTPEPLAPGRHNFRIVASIGTSFVLDGELKDDLATRLVEEPLINQEPTLEPQKVSPERGDENTKFTFSVTYKDPDNQKAKSVSVSVGNKTYFLEQADASDDNYVDGALYRVQVQLPAGDLSHSFQGSDGLAAVRAPASGVIAGPKVLPKTSVLLTLSRGQVALDAQTAVAVAGRLEPAVPTAPVVVTFSVAVPQGDGTARDEVRATFDTLKTDSDGKFSASVLPDQDGLWTVHATYAGDVADGGSRGSGIADTTFKVDPAQASFTASLFMVGLPVTPVAGDVRNVFSGSEFQTASYTGNKEMPYLYGPGLPFPTARPGMGFWLRTGGVLKGSASGRLVDHNAEFAIPVRAGWQQIGNPYLLATDWTSAAFSSGGQRLSLAEAKATHLIYDHAWIYDGVRNEMRLLHATAEGADRRMQPWQAAWFYSRVAGELILAKPTGRSAGAEDARAERSRIRSSARDWSIALRASNGRQADGYNYAGVMSEGRASETSFLASPPVLPGYVDLYFEGPGDGARYATDYRSASAGEQVWSFVVDTDIKDRAITVSAPDLSRVPKTLEVLLEDVDAGGKRVYLRTTGGYTFNPGDGGTRHMKLIVRPRAEGALRVVDVSFTATRGGRAIGVALSQDALVTVEIISATGQKLAVVGENVATSERRAQLVWDETRSDGVRLPAGIYMAQVTAKLPDGQAARSVRPIVLAR